MEFFTNFSNPPKHKGERNSGELLVEKGGVLTLSERVRLATMAGYALEIERYKQTFDTLETGEFIPVPAGRRPGYDLVDAHNDLLAAREKVKAAQQKVFDDNRKKQEEEYENRIAAEIAKREAQKEIKSQKKVDSEDVTK